MWLDGWSVPWLCRCIKARRFYSCLAARACNLRRSADALKALVSADFEVLEEGSMPLIIREHARKYQLINAHKLVLRRK